MKVNVLKTKVTGKVKNVETKTPKYNPLDEAVYIIGNLINKNPDASGKSWEEAKGFLRSLAK